MFLRLLACFTALVLSTSVAYSDTINLHKSCVPWQKIPANKTLNNPVAALLQCSNDTGAWLSMQIACFADTAELELRYRPGYAYTAPTRKPTTTTEQAQTVSTSQTEETPPEDKPLAEKEMLSFDFSKLGVTYVVTYNFNAQDWVVREKEPLSSLFLTIRSGRYVDVTLLSTGHTERIPLRGATKSIRQVVETCRVAKRKLDAKRALQAKN